ncbi:MAG: family 16 glycoside hydrolase [Pirellulaceae bacterium]
MSWFVRSTVCGLCMTLATWLTAADDTRPQSSVLVPATPQNQADGRDPEPQTDRDQTAPDGTPDAAQVRREDQPRAEKRPDDKQRDGRPDRVKHEKQDGGNAEPAKEKPVKQKQAKKKPAKQKPAKQKRKSDDQPKPSPAVDKPQAAEAPSAGAKQPGAKQPANELPQPARKSESAGAPSPAPAASAPRGADAERLVADDLSEVDEDFAFQGEYMGHVPFAWLQSDRAGLQVIARGGGKFDAVLLRGGLPGAGWDRHSRETLRGERTGEQLVLQSEHLRITVDGRQAAARLSTDTGEAPAALLEKYHRISPTQDAVPPPGATVLFDGTSADKFQGGQLTAEGLLAVGALMKDPVSDFNLHLEFRTPYMPYATGQARGNSGVYIQQRYEVQVLDSFGLEGVDNECGGLYKQQRPDVNMCFPPLSWQTYDIYFAAARWDADGNKVAPARITVFHNGEIIHRNYHLTGKTGGGKVEGPESLPILLQDHHNPVTFRNIWIITPPPAAAPALATAAGS